MLTTRQGMRSVTRETRGASNIAWYAAIFVLLIANASIADENENWWDGFAPPPSGKGLNNLGYCAVEYEGTLVVGGAFTKAGNNTNAKYIGRFDGTGWSHLQFGMNNYVRALLSVEEILYAGGAFTTAGGVPASRIAKWNGSAWESLSTGINDEVGALSTYGGELIAGGWFTEAGGTPAELVARWDGVTWHDIGGGLSGSGTPPPRVTTLCEFQGDLYAGGRFTSAGGTPVTHLARWDGISWSAFATLTGEGWWGAPVEVLATFDQQVLFVGGGFSQINGIDCNGLAAWDGVSWTPLGLGLDLGQGSVILDLTKYHDDLIATGHFAVNDLGAGVGRWDGSQWWPLGSGLVPPDLWGGNRACCVVDDDLYVVGNIESAGFKPSAYIARWSDPTGTGTPVFGSDSSGLILEIPRNPIRGDFPIVFHLDRASEAAIDVVDVRGSRVVNLVDGRMEPGRHEVWWRVSSAFERVPTGVYYIRLRSGTKVVSKSVVFLR